MRKPRSQVACAVNIFPIQRRSFENDIRQLFRNLREICQGFWNPPEQDRSDTRLSQYLHQGTRFWELFRKSKSGEKLLLVAVTSNPRSSCDPTFRNARNLGTAPILDSSDSEFDRTFWNAITVWILYYPRSKIQSNFLNTILRKISR